MTHLDWAIKYAKIGLRVFPVYGKRPYTPNGFHNGTTDLEIIKAWWGTNPELGIAIVIPSDIVIVDVDGPQAEKVFFENGFSLPHTLISLSKKGKHYWYKTSNDVELKRKIRAYPDIDILVNGYVVVPPSIHPESNKEYEWLDGFDMGLIKDAPSWVETFRKLAHKEENNSVDPDSFLEGVEEGERQTSLFRYACYQRHIAKRTKKEAVILLEAMRSKFKASKKEEWNSTNYINELVDRVWKTYDANESEPKKIKVWSLAEMKNANIPKPSYLIQDMVQSSGVHLFYSDAKAGKTALYSKVALNVANGTPLWGRFPTTRSGVLYLDIEQGLEYGMDRWAKIIGEGEYPPNLYVVYGNEWDSPQDGFLFIEEFLREHYDVGMIVIDTLADLMPEADKKDVGTLYTIDQKKMRPFKKLATDFGVSVVLIHHTNKSGTGMLGKSSGSNAITAKADTIWYLERKEDEFWGTLSQKGKNIPDKKLILGYNPDTLIWNLQKELR